MNNQRRRGRTARVLKSRCHRLTSPEDEPNVEEPGAPSSNLQTNKQQVAMTSRSRSPSSHQEFSDEPSSSGCPVAQRGESADHISVTELSTLFLNGINQIIKNCANPKSLTSGLQLNAAANIISEFDPQINNIENWLQAVDEYKTIYQWNEITTIHFAMSKLKGSAETWYRSLTTRIHSWDEWKQLLLKRFRQNAIYILC